MNGEWARRNIVTLKVFSRRYILKQDPVTCPSGKDNGKGNLKELLVIFYRFARMAGWWRRATRRRW